MVLPVLLLSVLGTTFQTLTAAQDAKELGTRIGALRAVPDSKRRQETIDIARLVQKLEPGEEKVWTALQLSNLSTEGDFGIQALQIVVDTLLAARKELKPPVKPDLADFVANQLAQLERYEGVKVVWNDPLMRAVRSAIQDKEAKRSQADFTLTDLSGKAWTLKSLKGKVVLVNFWATWCPPCRKEMPDIEALSKELANKGLIVLAISDETRETVEKFINDKGYTYPILLDPGRKVNTLFQVDGIPKTFIYGRDGRLAATAIDMRTKGQLLKLLAKAGLE